MRMTDSNRSRHWTENSDRLKDFTVPGNDEKVLFSALLLSLFVCLLFVLLLTL